MNPWWSRPAVRLPILLAILAGVAWYGAPRIIHETAGAAQAPPCNGRVKSEPSSTSLDQMYWITDDHVFGTWVRTSPCDGTWYLSRTTPPPEGGSWYPNGRTVDVDCARLGAPYPGHLDGKFVDWSIWLHIRHGGWLPSIIAQQVPRNSVSGLPAC